jgi:predicted MFS family arabinose efflux permease
MSRVVGGTARMRVVALLAAVLALNAADFGIIGAVAPQLEAAFHINQTQLGLLATVSSAIGALASVPMGVLADRVARVRLLAAMVAVWGIALGIAGAAPSYHWMLVSRLALGGASAAAGPVLASLVGDLFPVRERARVYSWILTGEIAGAGLGLLAGANLATLNWRYAFWLFAALGIGLAVAVRRLPEPDRGGGSRMEPGATDIPIAATTPVPGPAPTMASRWKDLITGFAYVVRTPTNRILIIASAVGYFFFAGLRTFAVVLVRHQYQVDTFTISVLALVVGVGALAGVMFSGRIADVMLAGKVKAVRIVLPALAYTATAVFFLPALLTTSVWIALPFFTAATAALAASNPPLDAARLDLVPADMWGRAESARTVLRLSAESVAPLAFGALADAFGASATRPGGLRATFLVMLVPLAANGLIMLLARRTYDADVRAAGRKVLAPRIA